MFDTLDQLIDDYLVHERLRADPFTVRRARLLAWIHVIAFFITGASLLSSSLVDGAPVWLTAAALAGIALLAVLLRRVGNLVLSGNLLVGLLAGVLASDTLATGGLYSDNLTWAILLPVIAFLFTNKRWGLAWTLFLWTATIGLYLLEVNADTSYRYRSLALTDDYYLVSYLGLFAGLFGTVWLFVRGNDDIVQTLRETTEQLRQQKTTTERANEELRDKEAELRRSNRDLELFAYASSHDLKEPLRMVASYSQLLQRRVSEQLPDKERTYLGFVHEGAQRMQAMLDDLLAYAKLGRERGDEEPVDLNRTLQLVRHNLRVRLQDTGGELDVAELPTLLGRRAHYVQVFQNLVANALKFHRAGVSPRVRVDWRRSPGRGEVVVSVRDNGIGIAADDQARVFRAFTRLHPKDAYEGSGIGLATVRRILDGLGARIEVDSEVGEGTTFRLYFPERRVVVGEPAA